MVVEGKIMHMFLCRSAQSLSCVQLFETPWTAARQTSLSITNSQSLLSIESVMPSNHLILCCPLLLLYSIVPSIRVFSNESVICFPYGPTLTSIHTWLLEKGALTTQTFIGKVMSLLFNMLSSLVRAFLPRSKHLLISWLQSPSAVILEPKKIKSVSCRLNIPFHQNVTHLAGSTLILPF